MSEEKQIQALMKLGHSRAQALEVLKADKEVDKMTTKQLQADLTDEQKKAIKSVTNTTSGNKKKPTVYKLDGSKKERKDEEKERLITELFNLVGGLYDNCQIANKSRELTFSVGSNEYSLVLTKHRK